MPKMKRISLLVLAAVTIVGCVVFASCSNRTGGERGRGRAAESWPGPAPRDLGGMVFRIANAYWRDNHLFPNPDEIGTPVGNAKQAVLDSIAEDFNITFEFVPIAPTEMLNRLQPAVMAGDPFVHLVITTMWAMGQLIGAGLMGDLASVPGLNLESDLWSHPIHQVTTIGGKVQATMAVFNNVDWQTCLIFQKSLWNDLNLPDPYEMVRRGEWTWDRFREYSVAAAADLNGDGVIDSTNDRWGFVAIPSIHTLHSGMGGRCFDIHPETGRLYLSVATPGGIAVADRLRAFSEIPGAWYREVNGDPERNEMFFTRRCLFYEFPVANMALYFPEMEDDFGILPYPKWDEQQPAYRNDITHNAVLMGIPITNNQKEETGIILEALAARSASVMELQKADFEIRILRSDEDIEMFNSYIMPYPSYDIGHLMIFAGYSFDAPIGYLSAYIITHAINDFASEIESVREAVEFNINEVFFVD